MSTLRQRSRQLMRPFPSTPLQRQWSLAKRNRGRAAWVTQRANEDALDVGRANREIKPALNGCSSDFGLDYQGSATGLYRPRPDVSRDACCLPFGNESFDPALLFDVLDHQARLGRVLSEAARALRREGRMPQTTPFAFPLHEQRHSFQRRLGHGLAIRIQQGGLHAALIYEVGNGLGSASADPSMALAKGTIDAPPDHRWRSLLLPSVARLVGSANLVGRLFENLFPARNVMPRAYYVEARRS